MAVKLLILEKYIKLMGILVALLKPVVNYVSSDLKIGKTLSHFHEGIYVYAQTDLSESTKRQSYALTEELKFLLSFISKIKAS